eukprot:GHVP01035006.1.p1 GENE.GHVP01035006.1~~GHVP01035006.1.p1  ORF type:complete len:113 (-),score=13.51 GHVP01035006.1:149-487(-)
MNLNGTALWKGITKMRNKEIQHDEFGNPYGQHRCCFGCISKPDPPTYLAKIKTFLAKEKRLYTVNYVPTDMNKADLYSRKTEGFLKSLWVRYRKALDLENLKVFQKFKLCFA